MVKRTINSVLSQTYNNIEVLVCDDGSTDDTKSIVAKMIKQDSRIHWIPGVHSGMPAIPRNRGVLAAKGEWLAFLDDDDKWIPTKIDLQLEALGTMDKKAACSNASKVVSGKMSGLYFSSNIAHTLGIKKLLKTNYIICSSVLINRQLVVDSGMFPQHVELRGLEDYAMWLRVASQNSFVYISEPLLEYRDEPSSSIRSLSRSSQNEVRTVKSNYLTWLKKSNLKNKIFLIILTLLSLT
jgi:teichuronic acid biosynthesis glycosyltransferase TuaG